jgi:hypothetical protein
MSRVRVTQLSELLVGNSFLTLPFPDNLLLCSSSYEYKFCTSLAYELKWGAP